MPYETILYKKKGPIAYATLNRPRILNAYNDTMGDELLDAHTDFDQAPERHVMILSGAGRAFCSGADVKQRQLRPLQEMKRIGGPAGGIKAAGGIMGLGQAVNWKPVISAVHGYVLGAGFGLAMATDIIVAAAAGRQPISDQGGCEVRTVVMRRILGLFSGLEMPTDAGPRMWPTFLTWWDTTANHSRYLRQCLQVPTMLGA